MKSNRIDRSEYHQLIGEVGSDRYRALPERDRKAYLIGTKTALIESKWFRALNETDRRAVLIAFDHDTRKSATQIRAFLTFIYLTVIYGVAFCIWGMALNVSVLWLGIAGTTIGVVIGAISANVIMDQRKIENTTDMQFVAGIFGIIGTLLGAVGIVGWLIRSFLFR